MFRPRVQARLHARLEPPSGDDVLVTAGAGPDGDAVALWSTEAGRAALEERHGEPGGPSFAAERPDRPVPVRLTRHAADHRAEVELTDLAFAHVHVQPLPGGRFLVAGARCAWGPAGAPPNARIIDADGGLVAEGVLGDGIGHLATTPGGRIWAGYYDEGVFGTNGWGGEGPEPIGMHGLARFDERLERVWGFPGDTAFGPIDDCYALNVDGETVWACYYGEFPVVRIAGDRVTGWTNDAIGVKAVITDGRRCALIGGYGRESDRVLIGELGESGRFERRRTARLVLPSEPEHVYHVAGRGDVLHVFAGTAHYRLDLDQL